MTTLLSDGLASATIIVGKATASIKCPIPSNMRVIRKAPKDISMDCTPEIRLDPATAQSTAFRAPIFATKKPTIAPPRIPTTDTNETANGTGAPG
ncbi:hypothetical protein N9V68_00815 [Octadecabacter sp.]|nr:hypothetical protein [Octadecabacter sp.]